jgi:hypothetical protein
LQVVELAPTDGPFLPKLDLQIHDFIAKVVELISKLRSGVSTQARDVVAGVVHLILQPLDVSGRDRLCGDGPRE